MENDQRLDLIVEAVEYCQKVRDMGMPPSCYSKALREPIFFLWELRHTKKKVRAAKFRSVASSGVPEGKGDLVYDHAVPFIYLQRELLDLNLVSRASVYDILQRFGTACIITKSEDNRLNQAGLGRKMPSDWNGSNALARYDSIGLEVIPNPDYSENKQEA